MSGKCAFCLSLFIEESCISDYRIVGDRGQLFLGASYGGGSVGARLHVFSSTFSFLIVNFGPQIFYETNSYVSRFGYVIIGFDACFRQ